MQEFQNTLLNLNHFFIKYFSNYPFVQNNITLGFMIISTLFLIFFYYIGLKFPDIDLKIKGLGHRSIVTHSPLLPIIFMYLHKNNYLWLVYGAKFDITRFLIIGLSLGIALHILYDLRPKGFRGTALIKFPYMSSGLTVNGSIAFMIFTVIVCLLMVISYVKTLYEMLLLLLLLIVTLIKKRKMERGFWSVIIFFIIIFFGIIYYKPVIIKKYNYYVSKYM